MNLEPSLSNESPFSSNSYSALIPENVKGNPHMFRGWREGLLWALINPRLLQQFDIETGCDIDITSHGLGAFISPEYGVKLEELGAFVAWYNRAVWQPGR